MVILAALGVSIIAVLAVIAALLWRRVWAAERIQREQVNQHLNEEAKLNHIYESLHVLALSALNDQVRIAEAGVRMAVLLDNLDLKCEEKHLFAPITEIYNRTRHMPTHERLNALEKSERRRFEKELREIEKELSEGIKEAARHITDGSFRERRSLH